MITVDFAAFWLYVEASLVAALFALWYIDRPQRNKELFLDPKYIWFCTVCTYTYINTKDEVISVCPRCGGYNKKA